MLLPLIILCGKNIFDAENTDILFRSALWKCLFECWDSLILGILGFARYSQIALVIFVPLVLSKIQNKQKKAIYIYIISLGLYFILVIMRLSNDQGDYCLMSGCFLNIEDIK